MNLIRSTEQRTRTDLARKLEVKEGSRSQTGDRRWLKGWGFLWYNRLHQLSPLEPEIKSKIPKTLISCHRKYPISVLVQDKENTLLLLSSI